MMLAGTEVIASRAQLPAKGSNIVSLKNCQIQFVWDRYLLHAFWELWSFATKNVGFEHRFKENLYKKSPTKEIHPKDMTLRPIIRKFIVGDW